MKIVPAPSCRLLDGFNPAWLFGCFLGSTIGNHSPGKHLCPHCISVGHQVPGTWRSLNPPFRSGGLGTPPALELGQAALEEELRCVGFAEVSPIPLDPHNVSGDSRICALWWPKSLSLRRCPPALWSSGCSPQGPGTSTEHLTVPVAFSDIQGHRHQAQSMPSGPFPHIFPTRSRRACVKRPQVFAV